MAQNEHNELWIKVGYTQRGASAPLLSMRRRFCLRADQSNQVESHRIASNRDASAERAYQPARCQLDSVDRLNSHYSIGKADTSIIMPYIARFSCHYMDLFMGNPFDGQTKDPIVIGACTVVALY